nr:MAG TPA: hypothetical protein [Caudoviricetes sp.]
MQARSMSGLFCYQRIITSRYMPLNEVINGKSRHHRI